MESDLHDHGLLYKVAKAYYEDNLTQQQIGGRFGLSRVKVSRMLGRARSAGVVRISITPPESSNPPAPAVPPTPSPAARFPRVQL